MDGNQSCNYIEKIVLEILDRQRFWFHQWRARRMEKFNITRFNAREVAGVFLRQNNGEPFVKAQKITVRYNNQDLHLCVRDLIYGKINKTSNSSVEFIYRNAMFSEIRWPAITINRISRVQFANENNGISALETLLQNEIPEIRTDDVYLSIHVDGPTSTSTVIVPCESCDNLENDQSNSAAENTVTSFWRECRVRRSVTGLQKLINEESTNDENHCRSSIHLHLVQNNNQ